MSTMREQHDIFTGSEIIKSSYPDKQELLRGTNSSLDEINAKILEHELSCQDWEYNQKAVFINIWFERIQVELHLNLPKTHVRIEQIHPRALGTYNYALNGIGVEHEITLNTLHFNRPEWDQIRTVAHECIHFWEHINGYKKDYKTSRKGFHSKYFIQKACELGFPSNKWGQSLGIRKDSPFHMLLQKYGVDLTGINFYDEAQPTVEKRASAKSFRTYPRKCLCTPPVYVWTAEKEFLATCGHCNGSFTKVSRDEKISFTSCEG